MRGSFGQSSVLFLGALVASACVGGRGVVTTAPAVTGASGAAAIAAERARDAATTPARSVAVLPMAVVARDTTLGVLGFGVADLLTTDLARSHQLVVVERARIDAVARELQLARTGQLDAASAPRAGLVTGARRIVVGTITEGGDGEFVIDARVANTRDGTVEAALTARAPVSDLLRAEKAIALRLFESLGIVLSPGERLAITQGAAPDLSTLLAYSAGVRDETRGDLAGAADDFRRASQRSAGLVLARSRRTRAASTTATRAAAARAGAGSLATGAINPSPAATMGAGVDAANAQARGAAQDRAVTAQMQAVFASLVIQVRTTP